MSRPLPNKPIRDNERYQATAKLPTSKLGDMGSQESIEIDIVRKEVLLGRFRISRFGIDWTDPKDKKHKKSWKELAKVLSKKSKKTQARGN